MIFGIAVESAAPEPAEASADLRAAKAGDIAAFERILIRHERGVLRLALNLLRDAADAEDAAQEVFLRLHKHLRRFDDAREFEPWLYRVTVNACRDIGRQRAKRTSGAAELPAMAAPGPGPEALAGAAERRAILNAALGRLTEKERAALVLRDIQGLDTAEVARITSTTEATVRSHLSNARLKLREYVARMRRRP